MDKTLRWLFALIAASLISYSLFASLGLYIGNTNYNDTTHYPSISINFIPIHKDKREQTQPAVKHTRPASIAVKHTKPASINDKDPRKAQTHQPESARVAPKPAPMSIAKHTSTASENRSPIRLQPIFRVKPIYPMFAIARNIEGWVKIEFLIAENGAVINPKVIASEPSEVFEKTAMTAVSQWRYPPGNASKSSVHIKFELRDH
ncbi:MAG: TonB family protein [Chromatiales bacterium]|nr:TonB family protein [Chromatiales bacterium]